MSDRFPNLSRFLESASEADFEELKAGVLKRVDEVNEATPTALTAALANVPVSRCILPSLRDMHEYLDAAAPRRHMKNRKADSRTR